MVRIVIYNQCYQNRAVPLKQGSSPYVPRLQLLSWVFRPLLSANPYDCWGALFESCTLGDGTLLPPPPFLALATLRLLKELIVAITPLPRGQGILLRSFDETLTWGTYGSMFSYNGLLSSLLYASSMFNIADSSMVIAASYNSMLPFLIAPMIQLPCDFYPNDVVLFCTSSLASMSICWHMRSISLVILLPIQTAPSMYFAFSYSMLSFTLTDSLSYTRNCSFCNSNSFFCCCIEVIIWSVLSMSSTPTGFWVVDCVVWWASQWRAWVSLDWSLPMLFLAVSSSKGMRCESCRFSMLIYSKIEDDQKQANKYCQNMINLYSAHCCLILVIYFFSLSLQILFKSPSSQLISAGVKSLPFFSLNQCATLKASSGSHSSIKLFFYCFETGTPLGPNNITSAPPY